MLSRKKRQIRCVITEKRQIAYAITGKRQIASAIMEKKTDSMHYHNKKTDNIRYRGKKKTHGMFYSWKKDSQHVLSRKKRQIACVIMAKILFLVPFSFKIVRRFPMAHVSHCKCKIEGIKRSTSRCCCIFKVITLKKQQSIMYMIMSCISEFSFTKCY